MSEIKPVYQSQTDGVWHDVTDKEYAFRRELSGVYKTRILYPAAAYEALQARIKELEIAAKYAEHIDATPASQRETMLYDTLMERDALKAQIEAQAKPPEYTFDQLTKLTMQAATKEGHKVTMKIKWALPPAPEGEKE